MRVFLLIPARNQLHSYSKLTVLYTKPISVLLDIIIQLTVADMLALYGRMSYSSDLHAKYILMAPDPLQKLTRPDTETPSKQFIAPEAPNPY